ncbi:hydroxyphenylacetyl-CoA thioesterase PaaI [Xenorhabdus bovienii]|uniref:Putative phenylacetic acid degradation protein with thioesterase/thiol ester dehydrase-isomerase domain n=1 Tax=Xenorhabdus bovienii str. feltiae Moldova TaxID=1398200 RepID=A0A077NUN4_XENBV|nr:hydroxyphenylacetyl-CoA thioesterase PaaI [Xenorhabdus bovienii]CDH01291.1 putative phenylacetic acid degradation protein with thioesterase/thiol ester dehydrase-isomerase domain [Xenorhabdus bovienii str. feltiae Moldova]
MSANASSQLAQRCIEAMYAKDACAQNMGMHIDHVDTGVAQVSMTIKPDMLNGHQSCHGGILFSLADTTFAYACNSEGLAAVASGCSIDFIRPAFSGDHLTATAFMQHQGKTMGLYDVKIINQDGKIVAFFRGHAHRLGHSILKESQGEQQS